MTQTLLIAVLLFAAANGDASTKLKGKLEESELFWPAHQNNPRPMLWTKMLDLKPGTSKEDVEQAMSGHTLAAELMGTYQR